MFRDFLFPTYGNQKTLSILLLAMRLLLGILLLSHGIDKLVNYDVLEYSFPDPLGIGSRTSLLLAIFAELFCSLSFILGFLFRLGAIPMIITMFIAFVFVHDASVVEGELAFVYLMLFIMMYATGPGIYSVDYFLLRNMRRRSSVEKDTVVVPDL